VRGCLQKAKTAKRGLKPGEFTWRIILSLGKGPNGKYKQKWVTCHGTRKEAEGKLAELSNKVHKGKFIEPSKVTLAEWLDEWMEKAIKPPRCTQHTYNSYSSVVKNYLKPQLGDTPLQKLTVMQIERYYAERQVKLTERTVSLHHMILSGALRAAVKNRILEAPHVATDVTNKPRVRLNDEDLLDNVWSPDEARQFLDHLKEKGSAQYLAFFALALDAGLRKGEMLGLQWKDLDGSSLRVDRQLLGVKEDQAGTTQLVTSPPKGKRSRTVDLSDETLALLREHKREQAELKLKNRLHYMDLGLMFAHSWEHKYGKHSVLGMPLNKTAVGTMLGRFCKAARVKRITVHGLRHTSATLLLKAGVQPHVVQRRLGHSKVEMTLNIYSHVLPSMQSDAASRLASLLHG
jgi:integrase